MATASAVSGPSKLWHVKGTWRARDDRKASAVWLGILWVGMIAGFGVDFPRYLRENPAAPKIIHVHAFVFSGWMLILTAQVLLVLGDRVAVHRKLGWFAAGWACLMAVLGPCAAVASQAANFGLSNGIGDPPFLSVQIMDLGGFLGLLAWGLTLRKNPAAHRRMMLLATVSFADPGFSRFSGWYWPNEPKTVLVWFLWVFYGNVLLVVLMAVWDWWKGRLVRSFVIGAVALVVGEFGASWIYFYKPWIAMTTGWVQAWTRLYL